MADVVFNQGDVITTVIKCANGETVTLTHSISLPRPYSRNGRVQGTHGIWLENANGIYIEGMSRDEVKIDPAGNPYDVHYWDKVEDYYEKYDHPIWQAYRDNPIGGHDGIDSLAIQAFLDAVRAGENTPIDVRDGLDAHPLPRFHLRQMGAPRTRAPEPLVARRDLRRVLLSRSLSAIKRKIPGNACTFPGILHFFIPQVK